MDQSSAPKPIRCRGNSIGSHLCLSFPRTLTSKHPGGSCGVQSRRGAAPDRGGGGGAAQSLRSPHQDHLHLPLPQRRHHLEHQGEPHPLRACIDLPLTFFCSPRRRIPPASPKFSAMKPSGKRFVPFDIGSSDCGGRTCGIDLSVDAPFRAVESVGEHVEEVSVGDTVLSCFLAHCGDCVDCRSVRSNVCTGVPLGLADGVMPRDGTSRFTDASGAPVQHFLNVSSFSEYTVVDVTRVVKVAAAMPPEKACLLSCGVSTGVGAAWKVAAVEPKSTVAVFGLGSVGLAVAEGARLQGAGRIIGVDLNPDKFEIGKTFGVTDFVNPKDIGDRSISEVIKEMTGGGADYCFECIGLASLMSDAFQSCRPGWGKTVILGVEMQFSPVSINSVEILQGKTIMGSLFGGIKAKTDIPILMNRYLNKTRVESGQPNPDQPGPEHESGSTRVQEREMDQSSAPKPIRCRAAVCRAGGEPLRIEEVVVAPPKAYEVRIKIICTSLCHSDVTIWSIKDPAGFPKIFGHEAVGVVESVGEHVEEVSVGDTVLPFCLAHCGDCADCRSVRSNVCTGVPLGLLDGVMPRDGTSRFTDASGAPVQHFLNVSSFSEYTVVDVTHVVKVAAAMPPEKACLFSCGVSTGVGAAWKAAAVEPKSTVAVFGLGSVGLAVAEGARLQGAGRIIGVDLNPDKFEIGKKFGITEFVNPKDIGERSVSEVIKEMTGGGADYCFECIGLASLMQDAFLSCRPGWGKTIILGLEMHLSPISINTVEILQGKSIIGSLLGGIKPKTDIPILMNRYLNKELHLDEFITHEVGFHDINKAFELLMAGKSLRCIIWMDR
ncbi:leucine rich repeat domain containing protein [Musa troglodytarum]|uniref:Leucine rich repeat domain containing protein n=1 Tax=Musa troglodytarum TaxID=320322 RepID=A0A9E7GMT2_9LILI|nr:leucine rich repeat domain containing protein [Musa troglodytarum]